MKKTYALPVAPPNIRKLTDPTNPAILRTVGYAAFEHLPFDISYKPNPRKPTDKSLKTGVAADIKKSIQEARGKFHLLNGGIFILAESVNYDNTKGILTFTISEEQGLYNGGHSLRIIGDCIADGFVQDPDPKNRQYCNFEIQTNVAIEDLGAIAEGRNNSVALKEKTLLDYTDAFEWIKTALAAKPYSDKIGYVESHGKPEDIERIVCRLTAMNPLLYGRDKHPIIAYSSKKRCMEQLEDDRSKFVPMAPIVGDILEFYEYLIAKAYDLYLKQYPRGQFRQMEGGVTKLSKKVDELPLTGSKVDYRLAEGWLIPLLASFRPLVKIENDTASWHCDPKMIYDRIGGRLIRILYESGGTLGNNPNALGKYENVYRQLYGEVDSEMKSVLIEKLLGQQP